jgi:hypothetical protein
MQTSNLERKPRECPLAERVLKKVSLTQIVDHFQRTLFHINLLGSGIGAIIISGLLLLISPFHQAAESGAQQKGVS